MHLKRSSEGAPLTVERADEVAAKLMAQLSIRILGKKGFRHRPKGRRLLPNCVTLEMKDDLPHLNILLRKPAGISGMAFAALLTDVVRSCPWYRADRGAFWCDDRDPDRSPIDYAMKEGTEALLTRSLSF